MKHLNSILLTLCLILLLGSCHSSLTQKQMEQQVESTLQHMTLHQKVAQLVMVSIDSYAKEERLALIDTLVSIDGLGGIILMDDSLTRCISQVNQVQGKAKIPLLVAIDGEWGPSMRLAEFGFFPRQMQLGALPDDSLIYEMGRAVAEQCHLAGIHINFAPVVDINVNPHNVVINMRSFGSSRETVATYGSAYMRGMQDGGIYACAKHFPGHGDTDVDSHRALPVLPFSRERLDSLELYPFQRLIDDGVSFVMMGHLFVPALDTTVSSISYPIVSQLLKQEMGFDGIVVTDALSMKGVSAGREATDVAKAAYAAGVDMLLMPLQIRASIRAIEEAVEQGEFDLEDLDNRVRKILMMKAKLGMLSPNYTACIDTAGLAETAHREKDSLLILELARQSMTAMDPITPLCHENRTVYIGYHATWQPLRRRYGERDGLTGFGATSGIQPDGTTLLYHLLEEGLSSRLAASAKYTKAEAEDVTKESGRTKEELRKNSRMTMVNVPIETSSEELQKILNELGDYDQVVLGIHDPSGRPGKALISEEDNRVLAEWIEHNDSFVSICYFGNPYALEQMGWMKKCEQLIISYADTDANERATAEILLGDRQAVGHLPIEVPGW